MSGSSANFYYDFSEFFQNLRELVKRFASHFYQNPAIPQLKALLPTHWHKPHLCKAVS